MNEQIPLTEMQKTTTFQMRINPEIKAKAESIFSHCGLTLTDAVNIFIQQSINVGGMPLIVTKNSKDLLKEQAWAVLLAELNSGEADSEHAVPIEDIAKRYGVEL